MSVPPFIAVALSRIVFAVYSGAVGHLTTAAVFIWDAGLAIYNLFASNLPPHKVVPEGFPGASGVWPQYVPPREGDSRGSCPALNAMANHGACLMITSVWQGAIMQRWACWGRRLRGQSRHIIAISATSEVAVV